MLISDMGTLVRTGIDEISLQGRNTQGVRLINLRGDESLVGVARIDEQDSDEDLGDADIGDADIGDEDVGNEQGETGGDGS
jgi:DNA gyrase subunit A